jgi:hypothetical protein
MLVRRYLVILMMRSMPNIVCARPSCVGMKHSRAAAANRAGRALREEPGNEADAWDRAR